MRYPRRFSRHRPYWWPEGEPWPPLRRRPRFFHRLGCMFFILMPLGMFLSLIFLALISRALGWVTFSLPKEQNGLFLVGLLGGLFILGLFAEGGFRLRHLSAPLDDLLEAAESIAQGKPTSPVREYGSSETRALARAFNTMLKRLQDEDARKRNLLADVSHELRTPLTVLRGTIEGMQDGLYAPDEAHWNSLLEEIKLMDRLVEDLRTLSLAESGALTLRREPTDLVILLQEAAAALQSSGELIQTSFSHETIIADVDPTRLRQVVDNLLTNAVKHTPPEGRKIWLRCRLQDDQSVEIEVEDNGPGIAPQDLPHIFERFYKAGDSRGMGLGLAIAKTLVEAHGGTIQASSPPGRGALMHVRLHN